MTKVEGGSEKGKKSQGYRRLKEWKGEDRASYHLPNRGREAGLQIN